MFFQRFYDEGLAQASYLIGCEATREAVVVDANRDVAQYVAAATANKLRITHVTETHIHADYLSGSRELAKVAGARLLLSGEGGHGWEYTFASVDGATILRDGDSFSLGNVRVDVLHTPGHTPEHLSFLVTDLATNARPIGLLSGDFVFVGDVGRPDLLERAAKQTGTMEAAAHTLFKSLQRFRNLPDFLQLWPGHGAGSACGKALGAMPQSTVGYEKIANWGLTTTDESTFVTEVLAGQPEPPTYFAEMKRLNRDGPPLLGALPQPPQLEAELLTARIVNESSVIDTRSGALFATGHVPSTLNIPLGKSFVTWAGWLVPADKPVYLIAGSAAEANQLARELALIGIDHVVGWFGVSVFESWRHAGGTLNTVTQMTVADLAPRLGTGELSVVDVRNKSEWDHGHLPAAAHIPLGQLAGRVGEIKRGQPVVLQCQGGARSVIASSVLLRAGVAQVVNLTGGYAEWVAAGNPISSE